jgi:squalene-associated FAD-dependent desaturase
MVTRKQVLIIGGGLAGLAAAVPLTEEGFQVTVVERKPHLGGRASSYPVPAARRPPAVAPGLAAERLPAQAEREVPSSRRAESEPAPAGEQFVDNCQHVLLKCCTNLIDFYRRLGVQDGIAFHDRFVFLDRQGRLATLRGSPLTPPLHLLPSFSRFAPLTWKDKLAIAYASFCMLREEHRLQELDRVTMLDWLRQHRQPVHAIETFWRTVLVSALNEDIEVASARYGLKVFLDGLLKHREAFHLGIPVVPLSQLYTEPCLNYLRERGSGVRLRSSVTQIDIRSSGISRIVLSDGTELTADYYVSSVPPEVLVKLLPGAEVARCRYFARLRSFETSPITAIYLWLDREVTDLEYAAPLGREIQWIFNKAPKVQRDGRGSDHHLGIVISASKNLLSLGRQQIVDMALRDLRELFPAAREATLLNSLVIKEPFATFSCRTGCDELRPAQKSPLENFFVAGDWTQTGWPPTMESAVRSGYRCAELILQAEGIRGRLVQPDLPTQGLARWLSALRKPFRAGRKP